MKKVFQGFITVLLLISSLNVPVFAEEPDETPEVTEPTPEDLQTEELPEIDSIESDELEVSVFEQEPVEAEMIAPDNVDTSLRTNDSLPESDYLYFDITGNGGPVTLEKVFIDNTDNLEVIESYQIRVKGNSAHKKQLELTIKNLPAVTQNDSFAIYSISEDSLDPVKENLQIGDTISLPLNKYTGFALVKIISPVTPITVSTNTISDNKISEISIEGYLPENTTIELNPSSPIDQYSLFSYDISLIADTEIQPESPVLVTIKSDKISDMTKHGFDIGITHIKDDGTREEIDPVDINGDTLSFYASSFSVYDIYQTSEYQMVSETTLLTRFNSSEKITLIAPASWSDISWEIKIADDTWATIQGETSNELIVSYPMIASIGDEAYIRAHGILDGEPQLGTPKLVTFNNQVSTPSKKSMIKKVTLKRGSTGTSDNLSDLDLGPGEADTYNIVVNFVFTDGSIAQEPIVVTLSKGEDFHNTVEIPQLVGYESYLLNGETPVTTFDIDVTNIQSNQIYTVTYRPAIVKYRVEHYFQNIYDNNYYLHETELKEGYTGDTVEPADKNYSGMYALLYDLPTIAADGSTVLSIHYDRYYYVIDYDTQGGTGADPIYARYDTPLIAPTPTKPGYSFGGWSPEVPETISVGGGTYTAQWTPEETTYTVIYWYENATAEESYSVMDTATKTALSGSTVSDSIWRNQAFTGRDDTHFSYDTSKTEDYIINGDGTTVVNVYFKRMVITFNFQYADGTVLSMVGKWGGSFEEFGYEWPSDSFWQYTNTSGNTIGMTFMDGFMPALGMPIPTCTFRTTTRSGHIIAFYRQQADGTYRTGDGVGDLGTPDVQVQSNRTFTITNKYEGFVVKDYRQSSNASRTTWFDENGNEYVGSQFYTPTTSSTGTQYGVFNGAVVELTHGAWIKDNGEVYLGDYKYAETTSTTNVYGVVDGQVYPAAYGYYYTNASGIEVEYTGSYVYAETTSNTDTTYGLVNGEMVGLTRINRYKYTEDYFDESSKRDYYWNGNGFTQTRIYYHDGKYYRSRDWSLFGGYDEVIPYTRINDNQYHYYYNGTEYTGTRYTQSPTTSSTSSYAYGLVNGEIIQLRRGMLCNGQRYSGTRYTRSSALSFDSGTFYGFEGGQMIPIYADTSHWLYHGNVYDGTRYTMTTNPSNNGTYYGFVNGEMLALNRQTVTDGWGPWQTAIAESTQIPSDNYTYQIRYERHKYPLRFYNYNEYLTNYEEQVSYQASLAAYQFTPPYPDDLPYGKYYFDGWYDNQELQGQPFNFNTSMPANPVTLFAKWLPIKFNVTVYRTIIDMENNTNIVQDGMYEYGTLVPTPAAPTDPKYTFVGWFYINEYGDELPYQFSTTTVTKNLKIYGKWSSDVLVTYTIRYETEDGQPVADPFMSSALEGSSKTFNAQDELYPEFSNGYFPVTSSHSILFSSDQNNDYTFIYRHLDAVGYTVKYVDDRTGVSIAPDKVVEDNDQIVVTEKFLPISGYIPDRYQKSLIIQISDMDKNVIIFRYKKDTQHAYYLKSHYIEKPDGTWKLYNSLDVLDNIGASVSIDPISIEGYTYDPDNSLNVKTGTVTVEGIELKLYYELNEYPYKVRYLDYRTNEVLAPEKLGSGKFSTTVSENAIPIDRYECITATPQVLTITKDEENPIHNVITFYYQIAQAEFNYIPVGGGEVTLDREIIAALTGTPEGSEPVYDQTKYMFRGWFLDEAGTQPVDSSLVDANNHLIPAKQLVEDKQRYVNTTFYALFSLRSRPVKIIKEGSDQPNVGLPGAEFELRLNNVSPEVIIDSQTETLPDSLISNSQGVVFEGELFIADDPYTLTEITAPFTYHVSAPIDINVSESGVTLNDVEGVSITLDNGVYVIKIIDQKMTPAPTSYHTDFKPYLMLLIIGILLTYLIIRKDQLIKYISVINR